MTTSESRSRVFDPASTEEGAAMEVTTISERTTHEAHGFDRGVFRPPHTSSGSALVDSMGDISITGDIFPRSWVKTVVDKRGRFAKYAALLLAEFAYWWRPVKKEREDGTEVWQKKFKEDMPWFTYSSLEEKYSCSHSTVQRALVLLEELGAIRREFRDVTLSDGRKYRNVMFIGIDPDVIRRLTDPEGTRQGEPRDSQKRRPESGAVASLSEGVHPCTDVRSRETRRPCTDEQTGNKNRTENISAPSSSASDPAGELQMSELEKREFAKLMCSRKSKPEYVEKAKERFHAIVEQGTHPCEIFEAWCYYQRTPELWGAHLEPIMYPYKWLTDQDGFTETERVRARERKLARENELREASPAVRAEAAKLQHSYAGADSVWIAMGAGIKGVIPVPINGGATEDEARDALRKYLERVPSCG